MTKKYIAKTHVSLTVYFENGGSKHVSFNQLTGGGSIYYSSSEAEQNALESHSKFNRLFKLDSIIDNEKPIEKKPLAPSKEENAKSMGASPIIAPIIRQVTVASLPDAKEYLANNYGVSRSKLRGEASIKAAAAANNIEFIGI